MGLDSVEVGDAKLHMFPRLLLTVILCDWDSLTLKISVHAIKANVFQGALANAPTSISCIHSIAYIITVFVIHHP